MYKGDIGAVREALVTSGFEQCAYYYADGRRVCTEAIFNDKNKATGTRRIKVWVATDIFEATQQEQKRLQAQLQAAFGARIVKMYFIRLPQHVAHGGMGKSFCIKLLD